MICLASPTGWCDYDICLDTGYCMYKGEGEEDFDKAFQPKKRGIV
uniref:Uncharacterized protein n=1 Tax=viral metagenome TaxID=1070528 RepID=A0A6M3LIE5_9ZZZZ